MGLDLGLMGRLRPAYLMRRGHQPHKKVTAEKVYGFLTNPNSHLVTIASDTQPIAYLTHVTGTTNVHVLYGFSPIIDNPFQLEKPKLIRALIRDLETDTDHAPGLMCLPASIVEVHAVEVPKDDFYFGKLTDAAIDKSVPWCRTGNAQGAMQNDKKEDLAMMKIIPVPLYTVLDSFEHGLSVAEVAERMNFLDDLESKDYLKHDIVLCKACAITYGVTDRDRIPTIAAGGFANIPTASDKVWAVGCTVQICPNLDSP
uniref:Uncharacterized protein n=1 Tax=Chaetoceros debilis TaxID=122233 RepID=A0A7S3QJJ1_9STRA|mmetsp:Transcript_28052/g.42985  ORF Transcript_28052/g.42985 Transcript_28052/m.42985 type:complete len:257 (-) Transcript_28052:473-1243(-)